MVNFNEVFYQIYTLGFCDAPLYNDGKKEKRILHILDWIDHLKKLGITALIFNPLFESDKHGYDTRDFYTVDCRLGTNADFKKVCKALHKAGIKIFLDGVFHHVGRGSYLFQDVKEKKWESPYKDFFYIDFNNIQNEDGFSYANWEGHHELVKLNLQNPAVKDYLLKAIDYWMEEFSIDGLRLDVAYSLDRNFMQEMVQHVKEKKDDFLFIGEMIGGDYNVLFNDGHLDSVTNYECRKGLYSSMNSHNLFEIAHSLNRQFGNDPWTLYRGKHLLSFMDNHDVDRIASTLVDERDLPLAYALMYAMPGMPCLYYGSEWKEKAKRTNTSDVELRPYFKEPIWNELTDLLAKLNRIRKDNPALTYGNYEQVYLQNEQYIFSRKDGQAEIYFVINISDEEKDLPIPFTFTAINLLTQEKISIQNNIHLSPKSFLFLKVI
ncbi:MAG: cyclomaltodextrinase [Solobacterium sp.]|nr:cyclomaltodextrinase [Solobacterium sp.]